MIKQITPNGYIEKALENAITREMQILVRRISYIAVKAVNLQRDLGSEYKGLSTDQINEIRKGKHTPNYIDNTGNLRNSIGFMLALDGNPITEDFKSSEARELAEKALSGNTNGITLILTAGMQYAVNVSSKGYDVLDSAELFCKKSLVEMLSKYKN